MRVRTAAVLSATALAAVLLAGCSGAAAPTATAPDLCGAKVPAGAASDAVTVEGAPGSPATATFPTPLTIDALQSTQVVTGSGPALKAGDLVRYGYTVVDPTTGQVSQTAGYSDGELLPSQVTVDNTFGKIFGCAPVGSRFVATLPGSTSGAASIYVLDVLDVVPTTAEGAPQPAAEGFPTVTLAENGEPTITIPAAAPPTEVAITDLKKGDGPVVQSGDQVLVQYKGVLWSDGSEFDSSWKRGAPASFATTGVVSGFQQALEGQTVGSQVLVVIPPAAGYGDTAQGSIPANSTLVFVVDILATQHAS